MARVWIEDRNDQPDYREALEKAKKNKQQGPGRYRVRWYDQGNNERQKTFRKKGMADDYRDEIAKRLGDGSYRDPAAGRATVAAVAEDWYTAQINWARSTRARYRGVLDKHVLPRWGTTPVSRIQFDDIAQWMSQLLKESTEAEKPLSPAALKKIHLVLKSVLGYAVRSNRIAFNPAIGVPLPKHQPKEHVYLDNLQVEALANAAGEYRLLVLFLAYTGVRWGEATAIRIKRVDLAARRVRISEAWAYDHELYLSTTKTHASRTVPIPAFLAKELTALVEGRDGEELLFTAPRGGTVMVRNFVRRNFNKAITTAGLDGMGITPHKLRHTAASLAIASGANPKIVQTMLGHKTATMTLDVYGHLWPDSLDEVADRMDEQRRTLLAQARKRAEEAAAEAARLAAELAELEQAA
ncbi:recombinase XerD [Streptomyces tateyamensis]|uniref:Recombinase XerD n=1 Tax=Streptomyces tateyamensis TaxID=565073 RepID=A0A2V4N9Y1_9ACTN|nr:site-specific integrase [Streptomyces tateyamensis]PYC81323.1 recombinase XerD [Streptomyces tateyamensis]